MILIVFENQITNYKVKLKKGKKFLFAFALVLFVYIIIQFFFNSVNTDHFTLNKLRLLFQVPLTMTIFLGYLFQARLNDFNWDITPKSFFIVVLLFILIESATILDLQTESKTISFYIKNFIQKLFYPSIIEEVLFRGLFINGLLAFNKREDSANIIQSLFLV